MKFTIDIGHGGKSIGAAYYGRKEQDDTLRLGLLVKNELQTQPNVQVKLTRETDINPSMKARVQLANDMQADYFLSIHRNAGNGTGVEAWVTNKADRNETAKAQKIVDNLSTVTGYKNRGIKRGTPRRSDFYVNKFSKMDSCLLEVGFIDNEQDNKVFDLSLHKMARSIARSLIEINGGQWTDVMQPKPIETKLYRVQIGPYGSLESAGSGIALLKNQGFETSLYTAKNEYFVQVGAFAKMQGVNEILHVIERLGHAHRIVSDAGQEIQLPVEKLVTATAPAPIKKGDIIRIKPTATDCNTGRKYKSTVYKNTYKVMNVWAGGTLSFGDGKNYTGRVKTGQVTRG